MRRLTSGDIIDARFEVEFCAGEGGMGRVYRCRDRATGSPAALKVMGLAGHAHQARFAREARLLAELKHPGIVRYLAHGSLDDGAPYLAMEWVQGEPLSGRICGEPLSVTESVQLIRRLCEAVAEAHDRKIVHRDLKPANVILQEGRLSRPKVLDFGLARGVEASEPITRTGAMVGTPAYMAPEQARQGTTLDARADVFALGCVLFEALTGYPAFRGPTVVSVLCKVLLDDPPWLLDVRPDCPASLAHLVARMLAKEPLERPRDAREVQRLLDAARSESPGPARARPSIGEGEQRFLSVVLAGCPLDDAPAQAADTYPARPSVRVTLRKAIAPFQAEMEQMVDGTALVTLRDRGTATDRVAFAARCALAVRDMLPDVPVVLATGRGTVQGRQPTGEVIDAAAKLLQEAHRRATEPRDGGAILIETVTSSLLDARFDQRCEGRWYELISYRARSSEPRKLLGRQTPCVGRTRELATLRAVWDECREEKVARPVVITGPAGIGKTRLVREWLSELSGEPERPHVFSVRADPMGAGGAFGMLGRLVRGAAGAQEGDDAKAIRARVKARVERCVQASEAERVAEFLCEMVDAPADDERLLHTRAARHDPVLRGDQIRRAFSDWLQAETKVKPVIVLLEDLQWGDLPTVEILDAVLRSRPEQPLCVVALARPDLDERFPNLWGDRDVTRFALGPLRKRAAVQLVYAALDGVSDTQANAIAERSGGNPFFLEELIRAASEGRWSHAPDTVLAMLQARLDELGASVRRVLRAGSIYGDHFSADAVACLLDDDASSVPRHCQALVDREILIGEPSGSTSHAEYAFAQGLWREASYTSLTDEDRGLGHALAAGWLSEHRPAEAFAIAEHYELGGQPGNACHWYARAARQALQGGDYDAALRRVDKSVACGAEGEVLGELRCIQAEAHKWRGENQLGADAACEAMRLILAGSLYWWVAAGELAAACGKLSRVDDLAALAKILSAAAAPPDAQPARVIALSRAATQLVLAGRTPVADELLQRLDTSRVDDAVLGWLREAQAVRAGSAHDPAGRVRLAQEAAEAFTKAGDLRNACLQHTSVGFALNEVGSYSLAVDALRRAMETGQQMDLVNAAATAMAQLGRALSRLGDAEAETILQMAIHGLAQQNNVRLEGVATSYLAWHLQEAGRPEPAEREARRAVELLESAPTLKASADAVLARVLLGERRGEEALVCAASAKETLDALDTLPTGELLVRAVHADALAAVGGLDAAREALLEADQQLQQRAAQIADVAMRESFLQVSEHRRIRELLADLG